MKVNEFFHNVAKSLKYDLIKDGSGPGDVLEYIRHNMIQAKPKDNALLKENLFYFLVTEKIIVRKAFCTIVLMSQVELLNKEFSVDAPLLIYKNSKEYSFRMRDENNVENYDIKYFVSKMEERITEISNEAKAAISVISGISYTKK